MSEKPRMLSGRTALAGFVAGVGIMQVGLFAGWPIVAVVGNAVSLSAGLGFLMRTK